MRGPASDGVVVARVVAVGKSRAIQGDAPADVVTYAKVEIEVIEVISGNVPARVPLEFLLGPLPERTSSEVEDLQRAMPGEPSIYFLHEKQGAGEEGLYRVTNSTGLWAATSRASLDAPLQEESPSKSGLYSSEIGTTDTIDGLVNLLRGYAQAS